MCMCKVECRHKNMETGFFLLNSSELCPSRQEGCWLENIIWKTGNRLKSEQLPNSLCLWLNVNETCKVTLGSGLNSRPCWWWTLPSQWRQTRFNYPPCTSKTIIEMVNPPLKKKNGKLVPNISMFFFPHWRSDFEIAAWLVFIKHLKSWIEHLNCRSLLLPRISSLVSDSKEALEWLYCISFYFWNSVSMISVSSRGNKLLSLSSRIQWKAFVNQRKM